MTEYNLTASTDQTKSIHHNHNSGISKWAGICSTPRVLIVTENLETLLTNTNFEVLVLLLYFLKCCPYPYLFLVLLSFLKCFSDPYIFWSAPITNIFPEALSVPLYFLDCSPYSYISWCVLLTPILHKVLHISTNFPMCPFDPSF